jgi:hypothetical protein
VTKDQRYNVSDKGRARSARYDRTAKGMRRKIEYDERRGRNPYLQKDALAEREEYEASESTLPFHKWLDETYPLPKLILRPAETVQKMMREAAKNLP